MSTKALLCALAFASTAMAAAATPRATATDEIAHLLSYLERSGCEFQRNGTWHKPADARAHLQKKHDYLAKRGGIGSAEEFIAKAASASSMSGEPYQVRCPSQAAVPSARWLTAELERFRAARATP